MPKENSGLSIRIVTFKRARVAGLGKEIVHVKKRVILSNQKVILLVLKYTKKCHAYFF